MLVSGIIFHRQEYMRALPLDSINLPQTYHLIPYSQRHMLHTEDGHTKAYRLLHVTEPSHGQPNLRKT